MTQPPERSPIGQGTDITVDPSELGTEDPPASSDPEQMNEDEALGGVGGGQPGGAG
ncbi:MAG: hypothetical protein JWN88_439 [Frankiales bacterium]|jgi:hypothetical protein|nr:hypothetical protein [Frankiales bacterium]